MGSLFIMQKRNIAARDRATPVKKDTLLFVAWKYFFIKIYFYTQQNIPFRLQKELHHQKAEALISCGGELRFSVFIPCQKVFLYNPCPHKEYGKYLYRCYPLYKK